jgi:hypothetical protein
METAMKHIIVTLRIKTGLFSAVVERTVKSDGDLNALLQHAATTRDFEVLKYETPTIVEPQDAETVIAGLEDLRTRFHR